jgi:hypothetical protein
MLRRRLKEPFGKAGLTVAVLALVVAMAGGAYAAGGLTKSQEKQVTKIAKKYAGKPGAAGPTGPAGPAGAAGKNGEKGEHGADGGIGASGVSVTSKSLVTGNAKCPSGGSEFTSASGATYACNGTTGFTETLPPGKTETGTWGVGATVEEPALGQDIWGPISFSIPLSEESGNTAVEHRFIIEGESGTSECPSEPGEAPTAEPGYLCVYEEAVEEMKQLRPEFFNTQPGGFVGSSGVVLGFLAKAGGNAFGTWAVTAPEE